jgi:hypothetical protein
MLFSRPTSRFLITVAALCLADLAGAGPAVASPAPVPAATAAAKVAGMRITGTITYSASTPADVLITGGASGGATESGTFKIDLVSTELPYEGEWTDEGSSYVVTDKIDATSTLPNSSGVTTYTADKTFAGKFAGEGSETNETSIWAGFPAPRVLVSPVVERWVPVVINGNQDMSWPTLWVPGCPHVFPTGGGYYVGGRFDARRGTVDADCKGGTGWTKYEVTGTLHVDAYMFVLPRKALPEGEWEHALTKQHHDYPAADIPVRSGTPYFAVTAGKVTYTTSEACGLGITLIGMDGVHYTYCHSSQLLVPENAWVAPGTELGLSGDTGSAKGHPHLHFEIRIDRRQHCPQPLLWDLYRGTKPPPDWSTVHDLPETGCFYSTS